MHELKREYTIVVVTHNMQQAARVADMTAFFSVEVHEDGKGRHGDPRRVRRDDEDLHQPSDQRTEDYVTGRFGCMRVEFQAIASTRSRRASRSRAPSCSRALRGAVDALETQDVELCDEVIAFDDEIDDRYHRIEKSIEETARPAGTGRQRSPARARRAPQLDPPRADRRPVGHHRQADEARRPSSSRATISSKVCARWATGPRRWCAWRSTRSQHRDVERASALVELDELIDRTNRRVIDKVLEMADSPEQQEWGMRMIVVSRCLERDRRQRRRHRRADGVPRHRRVPRVLRRESLTRSACGDRLTTGSATRARSFRRVCEYADDVHHPVT